jgi:hypothetical protein
MRTISVAAIALVLAASGTLAQNPPANDGPNNKATSHFRRTDSAGG